MMMNRIGDIRIAEIGKSDAYPSKLISRYSTSEYYDLSVCGGSGFWRVELTLKPPEKMREKTFEDKLFENQVEEPGFLQRC